MAKTRLLTHTPKKTATSPADWERLASRAITQAELAKDSRVTAIRTALASGNAAQALKRLGIIGETDILREFPIREK